MAGFVAKRPLPDKPRKRLLAIQRNRYPGDTRPRVMSGDESIIEVGRRDPCASPFNRQVAAPQRIVLEEQDLDKVQTYWSKTTVAFFQETHYVGNFFVENPSAPLNMEQRHDQAIGLAAPKVYGQVSDRVLHRQFFGSAYEERKGELRQVVLEWEKPQSESVLLK